MHGVERAFLYHFAQFAQTSERTAHADKPCFGVDFFKPFYPLKLLCEKLLNLSRLFCGRNAVVLEKLCERYRAERERFVMNEIFSVILNDFRRTAADFRE